MQVSVRLYGSLRDEYRVAAGGGGEHPHHHPFFVSLPADATIASLLAHLQLTEGLVQGVAINGETAVSHNTPLQPNDSVYLFPPIAGG